MPPNPCDVNGDQAVSDDLTELYAQRMRNLSDDLLHGTLSLDGWHTKMQDAIRLAYLHQAVAGAPDADARLITESDMARLEAAIAKQYEFLDNFAADIEAAVLKPGASLDFIPARAALYAGASGAEYWRQAVNVELPDYPRSGGTQCKTNCQCSWDLQCDSSGNVSATWLLGKADHCPDCVRRAREWAPLILQAA